MAFGDLKKWIKGSDRDTADQDSAEFKHALASRDKQFLDPTTPGSARDAATLHSNIDEVISQGVRPEVLKALQAGGGNLAQALLDLDKKSKRKMLGFGLANRLFKTEHPALAGTQDYHGNDISQDLAVEAWSQRDVLFQGLNDPEKLWNDPILQDAKVQKVLKDIFGDEAFAERAEDPSITAALQFFLEHFKKAGAPPSALDVAAAKKHLEGIAGIHHHKSKLEGLKDIQTRFDHTSQEVDKAVASIKGITGKKTSENAKIGMKGYDEIREIQTDFDAAEQGVDRSAKELRDLCGRKKIEEAAKAAAKYDAVRESEVRCDKAEQSIDSSVTELKNFARGKSIADRMKELGGEVSKLDDHKDTSGNNKLENGALYNASGLVEKCESAYDTNTDKDKAPLLLRELESARRAKDQVQQQYNTAKENLERFNDYIKRFTDAASQFHQAVVDIPNEDQNQKIIESSKAFIEWNKTIVISNPSSIDKALDDVSDRKADMRKNVRPYFHEIVAAGTSGRNGESGKILEEKIKTAAQNFKDSASDLYDVALKIPNTDGKLKDPIDRIKNWNDGIDMSNLSSIDAALEELKKIKNQIKDHIKPDFREALMSGGGSGQNETGSAREEKLHHLAHTLRHEAEELSDVAHEILEQLPKPPPDYPKEITDALEKLKNWKDGVVKKDWANIDTALSEYKSIRKTLKEDIGAFLKKLIDEDTKATEGAAHHLSPISGKVFLNKMYFKYITTNVKDGGREDDSINVKNVGFIKKAREEALMFSMFANSDANDQTQMYANRARCEALAKSKLSRGKRARFLPQLNSIMGGLSYITKGGSETPFAKLKLKENMSRNELRAAITRGKIKPQDVVHLEATLATILEGYRGTYLQGEDIAQVHTLVQNLRLIREEQRFQKIMASKKPYAEKLKEALTEDPSFDEAKAAIDTEKIFKIISDPKYVKKQEAAEKAKKAAEAAAAKEGGKEDADAKAGDAFVAAQQEQTHHLISAAGGGYFSRARAILARAGGAFVSAADKTFFSIPRWGERKAKNTWKRALNTKASFQSGMLWGTFAQMADTKNYSLLPAAHGHGGGGDAHGGGGH